MINLVIADDEKRVCQLIKVLGDWDRLGIQVVGEASNGLEALDYISSEKVDILITDIRMPGCSGLELIERISSVSPETKVIIISGYANFDYAQTALRYGVCEYLLKPISRQALNNSLEKLVQQISSRHDLSDKVENLIHENSAQVDQIRQSLLRDLINDPLKKLSVNELKKHYHFNAVSSMFCVMMLQIDQPSDTESENSMENTIWQKFMEILMPSLNSLVYDEIHIVFEHRMMMLMNFSETSEESIRKSFRWILNHMLAWKGTYGLEGITMSLGSFVYDSSQLNQAVISAQKALNEKLIVGPDRLIDQDVLTSALSSMGLQNRFLKAAEQSLEVLDEHILSAEISDIEKTVRQVKNVHGWEIEELAEQLGLLFIMRTEIPQKKQKEDLFSTSCRRAMSVEQLFSALDHFTIQSIIEIRNAREGEKTRPVRLAKAYMQTHYSEQITLESVSEQIGMNASYLSALFKKDSDTGFAKYLMNLRIDAAKSLLRDTSLSVSEICYKVGYNDPKHFTHIFEKTAGIKPALYRKLYG